MNDLKPRRDKLTILRLLLLTAGVAVGLRVFEPELRREESGDYWWLCLAVAILAGCSLAGPLFAIARRRAGARLRVGGMGGMLWLASGLGMWTLLVPALIADFNRFGILQIIVYCFPLMA